MTGLWQANSQIVADSIIELKLQKEENTKAVLAPRNITFGEIQKYETWKPYDSTQNTTPSTSLWLRFPIINKSKDTVKIYLHHKIKGNYLSLFKLEGGEFIHYKNGQMIPIKERANKFEYYFTKITLSPFQKSICYIKLSNDYPYKRTISPILYSEKEYLNNIYQSSKNEGKSVMFIYFCLISLITIFIFFTVFWLRLRTKLYLYYSGYLFFQLIFAFIVLGNTGATVGNIFLYFPKISFAISEAIQFLFIGFYIFFIMNLLEIKKYDKILSKVLNYFGKFCFAYAAFSVVYNIFSKDILTADFIFSIVRLIVLPLNFVLIFWVIYKVKHPLLKYFIIGQTFFFIGSILAFYIAYTGIFLDPNSIFHFVQSSNILFQAGLLLEVFCFSLAIGENIFLLQKEKETTSQNLIEQLQKNQLMQENMRAELDKKINEKTDELVQLYSKMEKQKEEQIKNSFTQKLQEMEMLALRSQMNPHFLFNSLNSIKHLIMTSRNDDAVKYLDDFSTLLRGILQNSNREIITVEEELEILELYLSLEKNRMGNNFNYSIQVSSREELSQFYIPPLLLQPFVENAIWHGLSTSDNPEKKLTIIFDTSECLKIIIEDNGIGRKASSEKKKLHKSMGMNITRERLALYNHSNDTSISLEIIDLEAENTPLGTRVTLTYSY